MKRIIALIATLTVLACGLLPAYAAGAIAPTEEAWYVVSHSDNYRVYYFATVSNGSEKAVSINDLLFEIKGPDGATVDSTSKYKLYPEVLTAGQTGWLVITKDVKDLDSKSDIASYALNITTKANDDIEVRPLSTTAEYLSKDEDDNEDVVRATITNPASDIVFDVTVAELVRDGEGKLLYITGETARNVGLPAGGSMMHRSLIKSDITDELEDSHTEIVSAEALAYTTVDLDD